MSQITIDREGAKALFDIIDADPGRPAGVLRALRRAADGDFADLAALAGVVDAGVRWQSEVPTEGEWWAWHPVAPTLQVLNFTGSIVWWNSRPGARREMLDGRWQFTPYTIPAPPKE